MSAFFEWHLLTHLLSQIYTLEGEVLMGASPLPVQAFYTTILTNEEGQTGIEVTALTDRARFVIIAGEPLDQEIVQHGPFVSTPLIDRTRWPRLT